MEQHRSAFRLRDFSNYLSPTLRWTATTAIVLAWMLAVAEPLGLKSEFIPLDAARPVLEKMSGTAIDHPSGTVSPAEWLAWLQKSDAAVRRRLDAGEEDSVTNLLRFGVTFTKEYRIDDEYLVRYGESSLVNSFAERRAEDLLRALASPTASQGFREIRSFVEKKGFALNSAASRKKLKVYLLANLSRMRHDFLQAHEQARVNRSQMFQRRGISLDTNLWPDYDLHRHLQRMLDKGLLKPGSVRRVAIVGPGLDFVNKQDGLDFYPPQTTQPFALLDSLLQLGLAAPGSIELSTLDISSRVNLHVEQAKKDAQLGRAYTVQLPWYVEGRWTDEFRASFTQYWQGLGAKIGTAAPPIPVPLANAGYVTRAIKVRPEVVKSVTPVDMNIVYQRLALAPDKRFDLIIGTNIFIYYGGFEQSLARANVAAMLKPGGYLLSSDRLQDTVPGELEEILVTSIPMTTAPVITDHIYCYRRTP